MKFAILYMITPILGFVKNYIKYKQFHVFIFLRTPFVYFIIHNILYMLNFQRIVFPTIIFERWFFFIYKIIRSWIRNDYIRNKEKYKLKYGLIY